MCIVTLNINVSYCEYFFVLRVFQIHESYDSFRRPSTYKGRLGCCVITGMATPGLE